jgi:hypothetical protein
MESHLERARRVFRTGMPGWFDLIQVLGAILDHLEEQQSQASSLTTASPTTGSPSDAPDTESTEATTRLSRLLHGDLTGAGLIHVEQCSACQARLGVWWSQSKTHALAAAGIT